MKRLLALAALLALTLAASAHGGGSAPVTVSSSRLVDGGHIRITATAPTSVQVGASLRVTYRIRNVSKVTRTIQLGYLSDLYYVVRNAGGLQFDTRWLSYGLFGPRVPPTTLRPGEAVTRLGPLQLVRWSGPLRVTPGWSTAPLPNLRVSVMSPGAPAYSRLAVAQVVATTGHLLDHCAPQTAGVAVTGWIYAPKHSAPPIATRCRIAIRRETGFDLAQVLVTTPRTRLAHVSWKSERVRLDSGSGNAEAVAWQFVVTKVGAKSVAAWTVSVTRNVPKSVPEWDWTSAGPGSRLGGSRCGGTFTGGGGSVGPAVEFGSTCR